MNLLSEGIYAQANIASVANFMQPILNVTHHLRPGENPYIGNTIWYNHKLYRPNHYHFISAITKNNLHSLVGLMRDTRTTILGMIMKYLHVSHV